jgi:hypothetical protein
MTAGLLTVARKRGGQGEDRGETDPRKRKSRDPEPRPIALTIRGRADWKEWVGQLADHERISINELVDRALVRYAREIGFKAVAPER